MSHDDPALAKAADRDLAREATLSSILFLVGWLVVISTTSVPQDLPRTSMAGVVLFVLLIAARLYLGLGFESLYERMPPPDAGRTPSEPSSWSTDLPGVPCAQSSSGIIFLHGLPIWPCSVQPVLRPVARTR